MAYYFGPESGGMTLAEMAHRSGHMEAGMSGSDYTTTPNLGLFMPNYDMDDGLWGTHLNANADVLDSAIGTLQSTTIGGPYLPLAGHATVSGPNTFSGALGIGVAPAVGRQLTIGGTSVVAIGTDSMPATTTTLRMADGQKISFEATDAHFLQYRSATQRLYYVVAGVDMWSVDATGNIRAKGTITPSTTP